MSNLQKADVEKSIDDNLCWPSFWPIQIQNVLKSLPIERGNRLSSNKSPIIANNETIHRPQRANAINVSIVLNSQLASLTHSDYAHAHTLYRIPQSICHPCVRVCVCVRVRGSHATTCGQFTVTDWVNRCALFMVWLLYLKTDVSVTKVVPRAISADVNNAFFDIGYSTVVQNLKKQSKSLKKLYPENEYKPRISNNVFIYVPVAFHKICFSNSKSESNFDFHPKLYNFVPSKLKTFSS